ncbi:hypothetical protein PIB30_107433, partial [Stylosanthes scabra]|nr:hypothetical protein [Stylosanthes scabra]
SPESTLALLSWLRPHTNTVVIGIFYHRVLQMAPFRCSNDSYCCRRTLSTVDSSPSSASDPRHKISTCLLRFGWFALIVHQFGDDRQCSNAA